VAKEILEEPRAASTGDIEAAFRDATGARPGRGAGVRPPDGHPGGPRAVVKHPATAWALIQERTERWRQEQALSVDVRRPVRMSGSG